MGAGQIGGIATLLDIDFNNAAGFLGRSADSTEAQFVLYFFSHAVMFCAGTLIEAHVVLTPAICVFGEKYKFDVYGGTHKFMEHTGIARTVQNLCIHKGFNNTDRAHACQDNMALLVLNRQFSFRNHEQGAEFILNRARYGIPAPMFNEDGSAREYRCTIYGWGSRRNGYLIPLLISLQRLDVTLVSIDKCDPIWNYENKFLCIKQFQCRSQKHGALCPDDLGSTLVCDGIVRGLMVSRLVDRPCGVGFLDLNQYYKFLTCGVDDSRDVVDQNFMSLEYIAAKPPKPTLVTQLPVSANDSTM